jgi:anti-sigma regulatory factor (Ser/Thr protein kinase)
MTRPGPGGGHPGGREAASGGIASWPGAVVAIRVPLQPEYAGILRATCAQLAPLLGCGPAETADLQLAVDEASGLLLRNCVWLGRSPEQDCMAATFAVGPSDLHVTLAAEADASIAPDDGEFGWAILTALVDEFTWRVEGSTVRVEIRKRRTDGRRRV